MLDKSAVSSKSRQPIYFVYFAAMATPLCLHSSPIHQPKPSTPSTPSTPKLFPLSAPFFLVNWSCTSNNVRCPWQAPGGTPLLSSSLLFSSFQSQFFCSRYLGKSNCFYIICRFYIPIAITTSTFNALFFSLSFSFETVKIEYPFFRPCLLR